MLGRFAGLVMGGIAMLTVGCGAHQANAPMGHVEVQHIESPEDAPEAAKTIQVSYIFDRDLVNKQYDKSFSDGMDKKGLHIDQTIDAHAHFDMKDAKITGTVTYVKKRTGGYSIIEADLVAEGHYDADLAVGLDVKVKAAAAAGKPAKKGFFGRTRSSGAGQALDETDFDGTALGGKPFTLAKNVLPTNIPIVGPLFLHAHFDLTAACDLGVSGEMHATTGIGIKGDVRLSAKYKKAGIEREDGRKTKFAFDAKAPNFELSPKPYLNVEGGQQSVKGRCSIQPTTVLLLEHSVGAKLMVEPWIELDANRPSSRAPWKFGAQAGVAVSAATDIEIFGRQMRKPKEFTLFDVTLTKPGEEVERRPNLLLATATTEMPLVKAAVKETAKKAANEVLESAGVKPSLVEGLTSKLVKRKRTKR